MGGEHVELSQEEVWDDSALIDSWNEALAEYKKYHSIHAKGGSIRDLEPEISSPDQEPESNKQANSSGSVSVGNEDPDSKISYSEQVQPSHKDATASGPVAPPPQALLGSIRDENLKKLLMSWYYAGYYTGLFEGQQQADKPQS